jgi:hypothetical protein
VFTEKNSTLSRNSVAKSEDAQGRSHPGRKEAARL